MSRPSAPLLVSTTLQFPVVLICLLLVLPLTSHATILHVAQDGDGTDGLTWASGYKTIGAAIVAAVSGDQIWVKEGTYLEALNLKSGLELYGGFSGVERDDDYNLRNWEENLTVISSYGLSEYSFTITNSIETIIDGFFVLGKNSKNGGGIFIDNSISTIQNNTIESSTKNGIYCSNSAVLINSCLVRKCNGVGIYLGGTYGHMYSIVKNCVVEENYRHYEYGGVTCINSEVLLSNCLINNNAVTRPMNYTSPIYGGGVYVMNTAGNINNTTITLDHCTISNNTVSTGEYTTKTISLYITAFAYNVPYPHVNISNSIICDPTMGVHCIDFNYSDYVPSLVSGLGNISADPQFASTSSSDEYPYQLLPSSPCIDAGTKTELATDILGASRTIDIPGVGHEGIYSTDMGCYEYQPQAPTPTDTPTTTVTPTPMPTPTMNPKVDINEDGRVDEKDLLILEELWGRETER